MIMKSLVALFIVLSFSSFYLGKCLSEEPLAPALYVFGDSLVDNGNNNWLPLLPIYQANYRPYGVDFPGSVPTGRVTNGKIISDFIAEYLGLPYPKPVKPVIQPAYLTGYTYASASCGILPETGPRSCLDLPEQIKLFNETKELVLKPAFPEQAQLDEHLANSIFFIWMGNNDYILYLTGVSDTSKEYTPEQFAYVLTLQLSEKIEALYSLGARKIVLFDAPPFGCMPIFYYHNQECIENFNTNATMFNSKLEEMIQSLSSRFSDAYLSLGKAYDVTYDAIINPSKYGLTSVTSPCCELATLLGQSLANCKRWGGTICENRDEYLFWDGAHPTEAGHGVLGGQCITNSTVCAPYSIQDLVQLPTKAPTLLSAA